MSTQFGLIIIGDEILSGKRVDKHMPQVISLMAARGLTLSYAHVIGDDPERITALLAHSFEAARARGDVVFCCGGIGATPDDHTRQCAAQALGVPLELHPQAEQLIRQRMQDMAREQGSVYEPEHPDNIHRLNMGCFPQGAQIIPNPYNKIPGFSCVMPTSDTQQGQQGPAGAIHFTPGFPVMAWPMIEGLLDQHYNQLPQAQEQLEKSVIVQGAMEASLTPLMLRLEAEHPGVKVFSLPSVEHPQWGRHIELGVKGAPALVTQAYPALLEGLHAFDVRLGPELVRPSK